MASDPPGRESQDSRLNENIGSPQLRRISSSTPAYRDRGRLSSPDEYNPERRLSETDKEDYRARLGHENDHLDYFKVPTGPRNNLRTLSEVGGDIEYAPDSQPNQLEEDEPHVCLYLLNRDDSSVAKWDLHFISCMLIAFNQHGYKESEISRIMWKEHGCAPFCWIFFKATSRLAGLGQVDRVRDLCYSIPIYLGNCRLLPEAHHRTSPPLEPPPSALLRNVSDPSPVSQSAPTMKRTRPPNAPTTKRSRVPKVNDAVRQSSASTSTLSRAVSEASSARMTSVRHCAKCKNPANGINPFVICSCCKERYHDSCKNLMNLPAVEEYVYISCYSV